MELCLKRPSVAVLILYERPFVMDQERFPDCSSISRIW